MSDSMIKKTPMDEVMIIPPDHMGKNFIPPEYLPAGKDEYYLRNMQTRSPESGWRHLRSDEVKQLVKNDNITDNWDDILVTDQFEPAQIKNSRFFGLIRIGRLQHVMVRHHDLVLPAGITNSLIISCDIGDDVAIHNVHYLAHYIIGERCILFNIQEMHTTNHAKFGNGIIKEGESENVRTWIELMNETGCRRVLPFDGMITADAYLWAKYLDDKALQEKLKTITQQDFENRRGLYGTVGDQCVIKNSLIVKDVKFGPHCYIKGANKLKNLTINSSTEEPSQIGEGVELVNGIIGYGCHVFYGCKAVKFILGNNSNLKYGARLINSFLGDNSTISCCEVLNNLIFPAHEQHHNNSFLIASLVMGQSNMAAGATIGSNHNSRANDNEIVAGRGFWPGLCTSIKHSSRFASFVLLSKSDYPAELNIQLPFSLLNNNVSKDQLEVMPAYWWMYNMYALARNSWKFQNRDKRRNKTQHIEFDAFAPDTVEEIFVARNLLEIWTAKSWLRKNGKPVAGDETGLAKKGKVLLAGREENLKDIEILGENMEHSRRKVLILKTYQAYQAYGDMLHFYAMKNLLEYLGSNPGYRYHDMCNELKGKRVREWVNLGGQLVQQQDLDKLRADIGNGKLAEWTAIHKRYDGLWEKYTLDKQKHAYTTLCELYGKEQLSADEWIAALNRMKDIQQYIADQVYISRKKDYDNPFRLSTFRNREEMTAAHGSVDENSFIIQVRQETDTLKKHIEAVRKRS
jgi:hypothetical protein